jgi:tetratricopeptide (TPR) repeat protein
MKKIFKLKNLYILVAVATLAYGGFYLGAQNNDTLSNAKTLELSTTTVKKGDLENKEEYNGTLQQTDKKVLKTATAGVVTYLPDEGSVISFGEILFAIDNKPSILLEGETPFYRSLDMNSDPGKDIEQLENALVFLGYATDDFVPDQTFDQETSDMLNSLFTDYGIETKSEITPEEQIAIKNKEDQIETIQDTIDSGGTTLAEVNNKKKTLDDLQEDSITTLAEVNSKKKTLDDAIENSTKENAAWQTATDLIDGYYQQIELLKDLTNPKTAAKSQDTRDDEIKNYEDLIEEQKRIREMEEGEGSVVDGAEALAIENAQKAYDEALESYNNGVDAAKALAIENAQKAYDEALESYNKGVDKAAELQQAEEELEELQLSAKSETFSPTYALASETPIIVGSYIISEGSAVAANSQMYNISSTGVEVVFQIDASDQDIVSVGDSVEVELPSEDRIKATVSYVDPVVTQGQNGDFIEVKLDISSTEEVKVYDQAPVDVFVTSEVSQDVLYVPVNALIALAEGGYALEIYNGESEVGVFEGVSGVDTTYVGIEIGVFTDGFVEVSGNISEGMIVVVPR